MAIPAQPSSPLTALAEKIHVEMVCRNFVIVDKVAQVKPGGV
jgi:hypothetical protein